jgi:hypothetical protein
MATASCDFTVFQKSWSASECPAGYVCDEYQNATWWGCWQNASKIDVCCPIAETAYGTRMGLTEPRSPEYSVTLFYNSYGSFGSELEIHCNPREEEISYFKLHYITKYVSGITGANYSFLVMSSIPCPMSYFKSVIPISAPLPQPKGPISEEGFRTAFGNNFSLDLERFEEVIMKMIIGVDNLFEKVMIKLSPGKRIGCITGYHCPYEDANVWKCWEANCVPIGDFRYGLSVSAINETKLGMGVKVRWESGLGNYSTELILTCDRDLSESELVLNEIARQVLPSNVITMYGKAMQVCDGHILLWRAAPTIGALFVVGMNGITAVYLMIGIIVVVCREGEVHFPNRRFWRRMRTNFIYALLICARRNPPAPYDHSNSCEGLTETG